jgi:hypothetical protein
MKQLELMANYADIAGGLAIIISLLYVGYQIRQGTKVAIAENTRIVLDTYSYHHFIASNPVIAEILARGLSNFSILSNAEQRTFHGALHPLLNQMENVHVQYELGYLSKNKFEGWMLSGAALISTPGGSQFWEAESLSLDQDFVDCIEDQVLQQKVGPETMFSLYPFYRMDDNI